MAAIFALDDDTRLLTVLSGGISGSGSISQAYSQSQNSYSLNASGQFDYVLQSTLRDDLYSTVVSTSTGSATFSLHEAGQTYPNSFTLGAFSVTENSAEE